MSKLGKIIETYLRSNGKTNTWLANELNVHVNQVTRWIKGENWPTYHIKQIAILMDISQPELIDASRDYYELGSKKEEYRVSGSEIIRSVYNGSYREFVESIFNVDDYGIGHPQNEILSIDTWSSIFRYTNDTWRVLIKNGYIIADWHIIPIKKDNFYMLLNNEMREQDINIEMIDFFHFPRNYLVYIPAITIRHEYRNPSVRRLIMTSMLNSIESLANDGFFFEKIMAVATTFEGKSLCQSVGMNSCGVNKSYKNAESFIINGSEIPKSKIGYNKNIAYLYNKHYKKR